MYGSARPTISVILPVFNPGPYFAEALASLRAQTFTDFEVVVSDDGSTDGSHAILAAEKALRIRVVEPGKNTGPAATRNRCLEAANGDFIAFFDADDIAFPHRFERQLAALRANPAYGAANGPIESIAKDGRTTLQPLPGGFDTHTAAPYLLFRNPLSTSTMLLRREALGGLRFDASLILASDWEMWIRILETTRVALLHEPLVQYRIHTGGVLTRRIAEGEACTRHIMRYTFGRLSIPWDESAYAIHRALATRTYEASASFLARVDAWLTQLRSANSASGYYDPAALDAVIRAEWRECCRSCALAGAGRDAARAFRASPFGGVPDRHLLAVFARAELKRRVPLVAAAARKLFRNS